MHRETDRESYVHVLSEVSIQSSFRARNQGEVVIWQRFSSFLTLFDGCVSGTVCLDMRWDWEKGEEIQGIWSKHWFMLLLNLAFLIFDFHNNSNDDDDDVRRLISITFLSISPRVFLFFSFSLLLPSSTLALCVCVRLRVRCRVTLLIERRLWSDRLKLAGWMNATALR